MIATCFENLSAAALTKRKVEIIAAPHYRNLGMVAVLARVRFAPLGPNPCPANCTMQNVTLSNTAIQLCKTIITASEVAVVAVVAVVIVVWRYTKPSVSVVALEAVVVAGY